MLAEALFSWHIYFSDLLAVLSVLLLIVIVKNVFK